MSNELQQARIARALMNHPRANLGTPLIHYDKQRGTNGAAIAWVEVVVAMSAEEYAAMEKVTR